MKRCFWISGVLLSGAVLLLASTGESESKVLAPQPHYGEVAQRVGRMLPKSHLLQLELNDTISCKAWTNLVNSFDPDHSFFLQSDVDSFTNWMTRIDDAVKSGDVSLPFDMHRLFVQRLEERFIAVSNILERGFDFSVDESYTWKRKDVPWPADIEEQDELWRKRVKNEYLAQVIGKEIREAQATNQPPAEAEAEAEAKDKDKEALDDEFDNPLGTPEEMILKRYKQFLNVFRDMDEEMVLQRYMSAVAGAYDPHTDYMSPMRKEDFDIDMNLSLHGIGAQLRSDEGTAKITELLPGGPAERDKRDIRLVPGDRIIGVGQGEGALEDLVHWPLNKAVRKIRGPKGTKVVLDVIPASDPSGATTKRVDLIRDEIKLEEQAATGRVARVTLADGKERKLAIIRLPTFYGTMDKRPNQPGFRSATLDIAKQLASFNSEGVEGLILDLRNNGGGSLREAVSLVGLFVRSGPVVQVREARQMMVLPVPNLDPAMAFRKPMVVMINRVSASASEIVAGALQDYGRALVVGDRQSHGKGSVQTVLQLGAEQNGSMKLTTASFYRINGSSTQRKGIASDIVIPSLFDGMDIGEDKLPGALPWTQVESAMYIKISDLDTFVPKLRENSANRLAENSRYTRYSALVRHVEELSQRDTVPLEIGARRVIMQTEERMRKLEDETVSRNGKDKSEDDIVLDETLNILSDMIDMQGSGDLPMETEGDLYTRLLRIFGYGRE